MPATEQERLQNLILVSNDIADLKDFDLLMERILQSAREFMNCDAGSIYIVDDDHLHFSYAQNDTLAGRLAPGEKLIYTTFTMPLSDTSIAGHVALTGAILNIPDAYELGAGSKFRFDRSFDKSTDYRTCSMLTVPLKTQGGKVIGVLQLINAKDEVGNVIPFDAALEPYVLYLAHNAAGALQRAQLMRDMLLRMISMAELRDPRETGNHVNRVGGYAVEIYESWATRRNIPRKEIDRVRDSLRMAAMLHDVGKIAVSDMILKKPGRLTEDEYEVMKSHTVLGAKLFLRQASDFDEAAREVALNHHERFDGKGYPGYIDTATGEPLPGHADENGKPIPKRGEEIPLYGRIVALADVYDALSSQRSYKEAWTEEKVLDEIRSVSGTQFDPEVVDAFFACLPTIRELSRRYA